MNKTFIEQLIGFLSTPYGIIGVALGMLMVIKASRDRPTAWLLFSICGFAASLNKFTDPWTKVTPSLVFPLQQIREYGRPLAIVMLILLVFLALQTRSSWRQQVFPPSIKYLIYVQFVILSKTLIYGDLEFALISTLTFGGIILMLQKGPGQWLQDDANFNLAVRSIAVVGLIFIILNTYQYLINPFAVAFRHNRFLGTTGNPQFAAVLLAATIPCLMFLIQGSPRWNFTKSLWTVVLIVVTFFLLRTGSRTGLLMGVMSILLFYRNNGGAWFRIILLVGVSAIIVLPFLNSDTVASSGLDSSVGDRFTSTHNSREDVWNGMWTAFTENILFGYPLQRGERMGFGENSWLAAGANLGLVGLIPMLIMGWESLKSIWELYKLSNRNSYYFYQSSTVMAGLGSMLLGSCFEPFLLGNITFSLLAFLIYSLMGAYLIEVDRVRTYYDRSNSEFVEEVGIYQ
jgi:hypothetical protein